jgi:hypothetical protein
MSDVAIKPTSEGLKFGELLQRINTRCKVPIRQTGVPEIVHHSALSLLTATSKADSTPSPASSAIPYRILHSSGM